jgi:DNA-directed RNA polymerase specialized sigma24 family protein
MSETDGSITRWIGDLKSGGDEAAQRLWERYFQSLVEVARATLRARHGRRTVEDEEDAALSAFDSFCRGAMRGRFPLLTDRDDLWRLLVVITLRKAFDQLQRQRSARRGDGRLLLGSDLAGEDAEAGGLEWLIGQEPTPEFAALVADEYGRLRERLPDEPLRLVLDLRLEGYTREEIAERLGCAQRTITRKLDRIRDEWLAGEIA